MGLPDTLGFQTLLEYCMDQKCPVSDTDDNGPAPAKGGMAAIGLVPDCIKSSVSFVINLSRLGDRGSLAWLKRNGSQYLVTSPPLERSSRERAVCPVAPWMGVSSDGLSISTRTRWATP